MLDQVTPARGGRGLPDVRAKIAAMGVNFNPQVLEATRALYTPHITKPASGVKIGADLAYGSDPRQKLDVYQPARPTGAVLIYIPGGGFVGGDKNSDGTFYVNLGNSFADHGILTITANYRLAPVHKYPAGSEDVASVVAWARANAKSYGADPGRIMLFGQSAGSAHVAGYLFDPKFHPAGGVGVAGGILMSGPYSVKAPARDSLLAYYGDDASLYEQRSPITHVGKSKVPLLLSVAEFDPPPLAVPTFELAKAVTERDGKSPRVAYFAGHNHVSTVMSFGTAQDDVGAELRDFIVTVAG